MGASVDWLSVKRSRQIQIVRQVQDQNRPGDRQTGKTRENKNQNREEENSIKKPWNGETQ